MNNNDDNNNNKNKIKIILLTACLVFGLFVEVIKSIFFFILTFCFGFLCFLLSYI